MSAIASLVIKASGRSVSNGGWLYFNEASGEYRPFRTRCRLFQETYHKVTPQKPLVNMFREWNLAEEVACHIKGAEDMPTAWRMLDAVYGGTPARTMDQAPEAGRQELPVRSNPHCCRQEKRPHLGLWTPKSPGQRPKLQMARNRSMSSSTCCQDKALETPLGERRGARAHGREPRSGPDIRLEGRDRQRGSRGRLG
jgi:hypothetical protein